MPASLIPDQRPFLRSGFRLAELQESMQFTPSKFERFLHLVRGTARELGLDPTKRHVQQEPTKWRSFISKMISQEKGLKSFVGHWPIEAYFDFWTRKYTTRLASASRKRTAKVHPSRIQISSLSPPLKTITNRNPKLIRPIQTSSSTHSTSTKPVASESVNQSSSVASALEFDGPYDKSIRQPCLKCGDAPVMVAHRLKELFKHDLVGKGELTKMGVHSDLDLDTLLLMGSTERDELFRSSALTNMAKFSIMHAMKKSEGKFHVRPGLLENDLRHYIGNVYTCPEHPALKADTAIPHQLCKLFNKLHIEHLIPAAILLGITTDAEYNTVVNDFDEKEREGMLFEESEFVSLSRLQKVAMKWAFGLPV